LDAALHGFWMRWTRILDARRITDFAFVEARGARRWAVLRDLVPRKGSGGYGRASSSRD
jgi:hypothetical protein